MNPFSWIRPAGCAAAVGAAVLALGAASGWAGGAHAGAQGQQRAQPAAGAPASDVQRFDALLGRGPLLVFAFHPL